MTPALSVSSLHLEYQLWVRELIFYKEEIKIFEKHLEWLINRNTVQEMRVQSEHFQNQFILQKEVIDHLKHDLNISEMKLASYAYETGEAGFEAIRMDTHSSLTDRMLMFRKIYKELKTQFRRFEAEWM